MGGGWKPEMRRPAGSTVSRAKRQERERRKRAPGQGVAASLESVRPASSTLVAHATLFQSDT